MAVKLRLSRKGAKKRPFYWIVAADERMPRDGRYLEKIGTYNPMLAKDDANRVSLDAERAKYWIDNGAQPTERVAIFLGKAGVTDMPAQSNNPQKAQPKEAAVQREKDRAEKLEARKAAEEEAKAEAAAAEEAKEEETSVVEEAVEVATETAEAVVEAVEEAVETVADAVTEDKEEEKKDA
ncbi:MAG: 30S ribosomal protein S16 [Rickettsiales bacterium]|nr:30S ribosomal protein S16 [Rickettsiales bacterium]